MRLLGHEIEPPKGAWRAREDLLEMTAWLDYARRVYAIDPGGHPFLSYVGVNFTRDTIKNYKFYFSFYRRLSAGEIDDLLPVPDRGRFDEFYAQWHPTTQSQLVLHRGTTFALKIDRSGALTHYYGLRVRGLPFGLPRRLTLAADDHDNYHGVCEEFTGGRAHLKRYFYCFNRASIAESLASSGLPGQGPSIYGLEYNESEGRDKTTWITTDQGFIQAFLARRGPPHLAAHLATICHDSRLFLVAPGSAHDKDDHSIYIHPGVGDGVSRFAKDYLKITSFP